VRFCEPTNGCRLIPLKTFASRHSGNKSELPGLFPARENVAAGRFMSYGATGKSAGLVP